jgi:two-component system response regulator (stage 0 sporulation protein F)
MTNILIIDDQPHLQELFALELRDEGYTVMRAGDAETAKRCVGNWNLDLVLLDLYLSGFEGWNLLHEIKGENPNLPVIIVTAYDTYSDDPRVSQADGYFIKNFAHFDRLKEKIVDLLKKTQSEHSHNHTRKEENRAHPALKITKPQCSGGRNEVQRD